MRGARIFACCLLALCTHAARAQTEFDPQQAQIANQSVLPSVTSATGARTVVPDYTETPDELKYEGRDVRSEAQNRLTTCALQPALPGCEATLAVQESASRPRADLSDVAGSIAGAHDAAANPAANLGNLSSYYSGCSETGTCSSDVFCFGSHCFETKAAADPDFAAAMSYMEAARQAGVYLDPGTAMNRDSVRVFSGEDNRCEENLVQNCCASSQSGKGMSNGKMTGVGSMLVFDLLMNSGNRRFLMAGFKSLATGAGFSGTLSLYGVSFTANPVIADAYYTELSQVDGVFIGIDPTTMAIHVAVMIAMQMMQCDEEEMKTGLKKGAALCHMVDERRCKRRVLGICLKRESVMCCFNSVLARVINEQGRTQLGINWGSGDRPACTGFTVAQLQSLDFSKMDLTEFYASIAPDQADLGSFQDGAKTIAPQCYYGNGNCNATQSPPPSTPAGQ